MANRHLFRSIVLQTLFEWDMRSFSEMNFKETVQYNIHSFLSTSADEYEKVIEFVEEITQKREVLDDIIEKAAPNWALSKMNVIDRNILRIGMYELIFGDKQAVPEKVAINEAVELAKQFGGPKSGSFINGVMGAVYRELGEPGKDFKIKKKYDDVLLEDMEIDQKGAAVVYSVDHADIIRIGMVHDIFGYWTLSKGSIKEGETAEEGSVRAVKEETHWGIKIEANLGSNEYIAYPPERGPVRKQVQYFLGKSEYTKPILEKGSGGLDDVRWFDLTELSDLNVYDDVSKMLIKALELILPEKAVEDSEVIEENDNSEAEVEVQKDEPVLEKNDLSSLKLTELKNLAKERGLKGYSSLKKAELIELLS